MESSNEENYYIPETGVVGEDIVDTSTVLLYEGETTSKTTDMGAYGNVSYPSYCINTSPTSSSDEDMDAWRKQIIFWVEGYTNDDKL